MPVRGQKLNQSTRATVPANHHRVPVRAVLTLWLPAILTVLAILPGCSDQDQDLRLQDLNPGEKLYVTRMVILERAKAVAMVDPATGNSLLDSLALAWGDSSLVQARSAAAKDPARSQQANQILLNILNAEQDSLLLAPRPDRLAAPMPETDQRPANPDY